MGDGLCEPTAGTVSPSIVSLLNYGLVGHWDHRQSVAGLKYTKRAKPGPKSLSCLACHCLLAGSKVLTKHAVFVSVCRVMI